jgi:segregation and condensation protein B
MLTTEELLPHVEALIFASDRPLSKNEIGDHAGAALEQNVDVEQISACIELLELKYNTEDFPFGIRETGGGYQFLTRREYHKTVLQLNGDKHIRKLSTSAMETLAIIAYKQPVTKGEVEFIRGVSADYSIQKLLEKELIIISGRREDAVGKPLEYSTSKSFMDYLGINSPEALPKLKDIIGLEPVQPTDASEAVPDDALAPSSLVVDGAGDLIGG